MYEGATDVWRTPGGVSAVMAYRRDTNDWNTINAVFHDDEYHLPRGIVGLALDVGAHIGAVTVALGLDNPGLRLLSIEPLPANARLMHQNLRTNGVQSFVYAVAAAGPDTPYLPIRHGFRGSEAATHHAFIGNLAMMVGTETPCEVATVPAVSLGVLLGGERAAWMKVDIEGGEYAFLRDPAVDLVDVIVGEYHPGPPDPRAAIVDLLGPTHRVTLTGDHNIGAFRAERR